MLKDEWCNQVDTMKDYFFVKSTFCGCYMLKMVKIYFDKGNLKHIFTFNNVGSHLRESATPYE